MPHTTGWPGLADELDFDAVSIEDAHKANDLALLESFTRVVVFGAPGRAITYRTGRGDLCWPRDALGHIDRTGWDRRARLRAGHAYP